MLQTASYENILAGPDVRGRKSGIVSGSMQKWPKMCEKEIYIDANQLIFFSSTEVPVIMMVASFLKDPMEFGAHVWEKKSYSAFGSFVFIRRMEFCPSVGSFSLKRFKQGS